MDQNNRGSMGRSTLHSKLNAARFPNMSPQMAAILGFILEREYTTPRLAELVVTSDGHVLGRAEGDPEPLAYLAAEADLRANLRRLGTAAGLTDIEWAELDSLLKRKVHIDLRKLDKTRTGER